MTTSGRQRHMIKHIRFVSVLVLAALAFSLTLTPIHAQNPTPTPVPLGPTLNSLRSRNQLSCGINQDSIGMGYLDPNSGDVVGLEVDLCRALAAAVFGDPAAVDFPPYSSVTAALQALHSGEVDVLMWNTPATLSGDASGIEYGPSFFYTGEGLMVRADGGPKTWEDLNSKTVCVVKDSFAEAEIVNYAKTHNVNVQLITPGSDTLQAAWQNLQDGRCDALSAERLQLLQLQKRSSEPQSYFVWDGAVDVYTHEAYSPIVRSNDEQWTNAVRWTLLGLVEAEQLGITSVSIENLIRQTDKTTNTPETNDAYLARVGSARARFVDPVYGIGAQLGLAPDFMRPVIIAVGNYGEIYERHFGVQADLPLARGLNSLVSKGGLMYSPDWR